MGRKKEVTVETVTLRKNIKIEFAEMTLKQIQEIREKHVI